MKKHFKVRGATHLRSVFTALALLFYLLHNCAVAQTPTLLGDLDADTKPTVIDLQLLLNHIGSSPLSTQLLPYADLNEDGVINTNDVLLLQDAILGRSALPNPYAAPILNAPVVATNGNAITITGVSRPNRRILITGGRLAVFVNSDSNGLFSAEVQLRANQVNAIYVTATNATFTAGIPQPLRVLQDSQPPNLFIDFPTNGATLYTESTVVAGRVGDSLSGFMGLTVGTRSTASETDLPAVVDVGIGNNGTYQRGNVPLALGTNDITVTATDIHGNSTFRVIRVFRGELSGPRLALVSGDAQKTNVHRRLAEPLIVRATQADGTTPLANKLLTFEVTRSDGRLRPLAPSVPADPAAFTNDINRTAHGVMRLQLFTDANGEARALWAMGGDAGCGNNRVCVMSAGISNAVYFCASADAALPKQINIGTGNNQKAETGGFLPEPLRAWVNDSCNGNQDMPVTFTVIQGSGRLYRVGDEVTSLTSSNQSLLTSPPTSITIPTTRTGHAEVLLQLGPDAGQNIVEASYLGNPNLPATFIAYGVARDASKPTTLTGLVLDNTSCPIGGATCRVSVGGQMFTTTTDNQGRFVFARSTLNSNELSTLPSGPAQLFINGSTATNLLGATIPTNSFPSLEFSLILIPNAENSLPSPVLLPRLNLNNQRLYYGTNDLLLTCEGMEGLKMTIKAGSMRKPDGTLVTPDNPSFVSLNQVHHDKVPMPIPDGASPPFAWTLQPGGATFDPPIQIEYPNMSGLPAGTIAYFLSFNHDTRRFEIIASGHVREDSSTIVSDPGAGLTLAGWGCSCPPYSVTGDCESCEASPAEAINAAAGNFEWIDPPIRESTDVEAGRCGQADLDVNLTFHTTCNADGTCGLRVEFKAVVDRKWLQRITNPDDRITVEIHENKHRDVFRAYFDSVVTEAQSINNTTFPNKKALNAAKKAFIKKEQRLDAEAKTANALVHVGPEAEADAIECGKILERAQPALTPLNADPLNESPFDFKVTKSEEEWHVSINGQSLVSDSLSYFLASNISAPDQFGPGGPGTVPDFVSDDFVRITAVGQTKVNGVAEGPPKYAFSDFFRIEQGKTIPLPSLTLTDTPPRSPESIRATPDQTTLTQEGQTTVVRVTATFPDGGSEDRTPRTAGTTYRVSNPTIATIDENGVVTAHARGNVFITAVNEGATAVTPLNVAFGDPLTVVVGFIKRADGTPAAGVAVSVGGFAAGVTGTDGRFSIANVPTSFGRLTVTAQLVEGGVRFVGSARQLVPAPASITEAGILTLQPFVTNRVADLAAGISHTLALKRDRSLWAWGGNSAGQLGDGTATTRTSPVRIDLDNDWLAVTAGDNFTAALKTNGTLWAWGQNNQGQLGDGTTAIKRNSVRIGTDSDWAAVAAGGTHTVALKSDGSLWAWGFNFNGQLGDGTTTNKSSPLRIGTDNDWLTITAGDNFTVALKTDGSLWAWGANGQGQLGDGTTTGRTSPARIGTANDWAAIVAGGSHIVAVKTDGSLWTWGWNSSGQVGDGSNVNRTAPVRLGLDNDWAGGAAGNDHSVAVKLDGTLWAWGDNSLGELGDGTFADKFAPVRIGFASDWQVATAGASHTIARKTDGTLWAWGQNAASQLGDNRSSPARIGAAADWTLVSTGDEHAAALRSDGTLWTWGRNSFGELGDGTTANKSSPVPVGAASDWAAVVAGDVHTLARKNDGSLWTWGYNASGQLGDGTNVNRTSPVRVGAANDWATFAGGQLHTLAVKADGSLWAWGENGQGQLGDGTNVDKRTPTRIGADNDWLAVGAGSFFSVALRTNGSLWAWGLNQDGQLGDGTTTNKTSPVRIGADNDWIAVVAGDRHTVARKNDGSLWAWGYNVSGQLGDGTFVRKLSPVRIGLETNWAVIAAGDLHTLAIKTDGSLWAWGRNAEAQLGDGTTVARNSPVSIGAANDWTAVTAGELHTIARKLDGSLWSWGNNDNGELGDASTVGPIGGTADWGLP